MSIVSHPLETALASVQADEASSTVARWLRFAHVRPGDVVELQALNVVFGNSVRTYVAHASSKTQVLRLLDEAKRYECPGIYWIANRVDAAVATRLGIDKWNPAPKGTSTTDHDIVCRTVLFIDVDAERPRGTSATEAELGAAVDVASRIHDWLAGALGSSAALGYGASGNGRGVYVALADLPEAEAGPRVKAVLVGLDALFTTTTAKVDTAVSDAKRLVPAFGTMKKKGAAGIVERPHRRTAFACADSVERIGIEGLDLIVSSLRAALDAQGNAAIDKALGMKALKTATTTRNEGESPFARANAVDVSEVLAWVGATDGDRPRCPGCGESDQGVVVIANGLKCSHARCASKGKPDGFRTPVDVVVEARDVSPREAVALLAERFGFEGFTSRTEPSTPTLKASVQTVIASLAPAARVRALASLGPVVRLPSGLPTLDKACRGGVPTRRLVVVGGAPGAGKTTLATNLLWRWAKAGVPVAMLAVDEDADGILMRIAQLEGIDAERIEERDPTALEQLATAVDAMPLVLVDGDETAGSVEGAAAMLAARAGTGPSVLVVDSIQTARAKGTEEAGSPRERIDCVLRALKTARDAGVLVIATCELARGSYRSKNSADQINDLAAFKESGGIEYAAQTALVLRSVPEESALVDVAVAKNRAYRKDPFRLRLDHETTLLTEVDAPPVPEGRATRADTLEKDAAAVRLVLVDQPGINGVRAVRTSLRARRLPMGNDRVDAALEYLRQRGELENRGGSHRPSLWLRRVEQEGGEDE